MGEKRPFPPLSARPLGDLLAWLAGLLVLALLTFGLRLPSRFGPAIGILLSFVLYGMVFLGLSLVLNPKSGGQLAAEAARLQFDSRVRGGIAAIRTAGEQVLAFSAAPSVRDTRVGEQLRSIGASAARIADKMTGHPRLTLPNVTLIATFLGLAVTIAREYLELLSGETNVGREQRANLTDSVEVQSLPRFQRALDEIERGLDKREVDALIVAMDTLEALLKTRGLGEAPAEAGRS